MVGVSVNYKGYWGLKGPTFENTPDPKFYFPSAKHEKGVQCLLYGIKEGKSAVLLSGDIGCGNGNTNPGKLLASDEQRIGESLANSDKLRATSDQQLATRKE